MAQIVPDMLHENESEPQMTRKDAATQLEQLWKQQEGLGSDLWEDARLREVCKYLLGAKGLRVPPRFEFMIPKYL